MSINLQHAKQSSSLASEIRQATGVALDHCYQCGKCAAGCPVADTMDHAPCQILRLLQYESSDFDRQALQSEAIWLCLACATCHTRCPQTIDIPKVMDFLRAQALQQGLAHPRSKNLRAFHQAFLSSIEAHGRLYEVGLMGRYKLRTGHLFQDMALGPKLHSKGKLGLLPHKIQGKAALRRLFRRAGGG